MKTLIAITITVTIILSVVYLWNIRIFKTISDSMNPKIKKGYLVIVYRPKELRVGDIVSYQLSQEPTPTTHRISKIYYRKDTFYMITKGDANKDNDPYPVSEQEIVGKVVLIIHGLDVHQSLLKLILILTFIIFFYLYGRIIFKIIHPMSIK